MHQNISPLAAAPPVVAFVSLVAGLAGLATVSAQQPETPPDRILIEVGVVSSIDDIEVPARVKGFINELLVDEGAEISKGDTLAQLDLSTINNELAAARVRLANAERQANDDTPLKYAEATLAVAAKELEINVGLNARNALPDQELERSRLSKIQAELQVQRSMAQMDIDRGAVDIEKQNVASVEELQRRHTIIAPISGQVTAIRRRAGEYIQEGETLLRLIDLSRVRVEGSVDVSEVNPDELPGRQVIVRLKLARDEVVTFNGSVTSLGLDTLEPSTYLVQAVVENRKRGNQWLLRPNSRVEIEILLTDSTQAETSASGKRPE